jgi:peroxiredoxin Q/BCP
MDIGDDAPDFKLKDADENEISLKGLRGRKVVLYFYPEDDTPGCTTEAMDFTKLKDEFAKENAVVIGISKDSCESHRKFIAKRSLSIILLSDPNLIAHNLYGVWRLKKFAGKEYVGTVRSTFLIDESGKIAKIWDSVIPIGHAHAVLEEIRK